MEKSSTRSLKAILEKEFPRLRIRSARRILTGWDNVVLEINDQYIFRFPRFEVAAESLQREIKLLSILNPKLSLPIPNYEFRARARKEQFAFGGYRKIPGTPVTIRNYRESWTIKLAEGLARFLRELHSIKPAENIKSLLLREGPGDISGSFRKHQAWLRARASRDLDRKTRELSESFFEDGIRRLKRSNFSPVLVHSDLTTKNILVNPLSGKLTGVLDWGDARISDPAMDFSGLFEINRDLGHETLRLYKESSFDLDLLKRVEIYWRMLPYFEVMYGFYSKRSRIRRLGIRDLRRRLREKNLT